MERSRLEQDFENRRLEQTIAIAREELGSLEQRSADNKAAIMAAKQEMRENTSHAIGNLWSLENLYELAALSQYAGQVSEQLSEYERDARRMLVLERLLDSPYFARIDFKFEDEELFENIYIGRSSLQDHKTQEIYIYDWRSPLSSVFYRFGTGKAFYESPGGRINGEVNLKRQYEIKKGKLEYYFDADVQIIDDFLRKLLSQNTSSQMKTIVETIQKDQDMIIRDQEMDLLMVQGAAGSGKTSVALHRAAYLMYQGLSNKLTSNDIVIISPHTLFERYISNVLPELGEKNVNSLVFEEILNKVLQGKSLQTRNHFLEGLLSAGNPEDGSILKKSLTFKTSLQFMEILKRFIADLPKHWIPFADIYYDGEYIAGRHFLQDKIIKGKKGSLLGLRLQQLENSILKAVHAKRKKRLDKLIKFIDGQKAPVLEVKAAARRLSIHESTALRKKIRRFTELDCLELYRKLFHNKKSFYRLAQGIELPDGMEAIIDFTCENLKKDELPYDDALALAFLQLNTKGCPDYQEIKQVVIDEAQDYYPVHYEILHSLFPKSSLTLLGDVQQTVGKQEDLSFYDQVSKIFAKPKSLLVTLDKSFRSTRQILLFSARFLNPDVKVNSFGRNGDTPAVFAARSQEALADLIITEVETCREKNYASIGLICKTEHDAVSLYERLKNRTPLQLIKSDVEMDLKGVFIIPLYMSKGLEFDAVLICDADQGHYHSEDDKNLLYIACTRALHRLNLFYAGDISPLLL